MQINLNVQPKYFTDIREGLKILEGRLAKEKYRLLNIGDTILFDNGDDTIVKKIDGIHIFDSFSSGADFLRVKNIIPGIESVSELVSIYRQFYSEEDEKKYGVVFLKLID